MKNSIFFLGLFLFLFSCVQDQEDLTVADIETNLAEFRSTDSTFTSFNIPFPEGTTFDFGGAEVRFTVPDPYFIVGIDQSGNYHQSLSGGTGSITCECTEGAGCDPIKQGDDMGCLMKDGCTKCTKEKSGIIGVQADLVDIAIMHPENNLMITEFSQLDGQYLLPRSFFDYPEVNNILSTIDSLQMELPDAPKDMVFINVQGYILPLEVNLNGDNVSLKASGGSGNNDVSCSCNTEGNCSKEKHWTGGVVWCNSSNCTSCTMTVSIVNSDDEMKLFSAINGKISIE